jgi:hypothetical protein
MADFAPKLKRILRDAGCKRVRPGKGDHDIWFSPITIRNFPVDHKIKSRHIADHFEDGAYDAPPWIRRTFPVATATSNRGACSSTCCRR